MRSLLIPIILLLILNQVIALTCSADNTGKQGTCINQTYAFFGKQVYKSCYYNPYYDSGTIWQGYTQCYATIRIGSLISDKGTPVVEAWTTDTSKLNLCANYNGKGCDVSSGDGFTLLDTANDRGYCDASDANCVKCDSNKIETKSWIGGLQQINGAGDNKCESGCGADSICDELTSASWTGRQIGSTQYEAYCGASCTTTDQRCRSSYGASNLCELKHAGDVCIVDSCDASNRLIDYNNNHNFDNATCDNSCGCDNTYETPLCDAECSASNECDNQQIGYNTINAGCDDVCIWRTCGLYKWDSISCRTSCTINDNCYNAVCDLTGEGINTCIIDSVKPSVSINYPTGTPQRNSTITLQYIASENADVTPSCEYILDTNTISLGDVTLGIHNVTLTVNQGWHSVKVNCTDDAGNEGTSLTENFLYDTSAPNYDSISYTDLTPTVDDSLMNGDLVLLSTHWSDNFILDTAVLETDITGAWQVQEAKGLTNDWSNFTINSSCEGNRNIQWRITMNDSTGNTITTPIQQFYVHNPSTDFTITQHTTNEQMPMFTGYASMETNKKPDNSLNDTFIGEFTLEHTGWGTQTRYGFKLNESLPAGIIIKISNNAIPTDELTLTDSLQYPPWCQTNIKGDACQVWIWMNLAQGNDQATYLRSITINSEDIS